MTKIAEEELLKRWLLPFVFNDFIDSRRFKAEF